MTVQHLDGELSFAPLGLIKMFNCGGALRGNLDYDTNGKSVTMQVLGCGIFGVYASRQPHAACILNATGVNSTDLPFSYDHNSGLVTVSLPQAEEEGHLWTVHMSF